MTENRPAAPAGQDRSSASFSVANSQIAASNPTPPPPVIPHTASGSEGDERAGAKPIIRGRPRSTSISSGSPGPAPGTPLPVLYPTDPFLALSNSAASTAATAPSGAFSLPTVTPITTMAASSSSSPFANFSFGRNSGVSRPVSASFSAPSSGGSSGWGHRSSLSVPSLFAPSPLVPGSAPKGGRHRRTQSVSPPGGLSPEDLAAAGGGLAAPARAGAPRTEASGQNQQQQQPRLGGSFDSGGLGALSSSPGGKNSKQSFSAGGSASGDLFPPLSRTASPNPTGWSSAGRTQTSSAPGFISTTAYASSSPHAQHVLHDLHRAQQQRSSSSPSSSSAPFGSPSSSTTTTTSPAPGSSSSGTSTSATTAVSSPHHHHHHHYHHHHATSHAALLQGVRSKSHPHSPTLDGSSSSSSGSVHSPQSMSPLSRSPSSSSSPSMFPSNNSLLRRSSSGSTPSPRITASPSSPPFGASLSGGGVVNRNVLPAPQYKPDHDMEIPFALDEDHQTDHESRSPSLSHARALDEAMSDAIDRTMSSLSHSPRSRSSGSSGGGAGLSSPPLLPQQQQDLAVMSTSPPLAGACCGAVAGPTTTVPPRARRGSHSRVADAVGSASMSPASLYLEQEDVGSPSSTSSASPRLRACPSPTLCPLGGGRAAGPRSISPPLIATSPDASSAVRYTDTLFPTSGPLPPPGQSPSHSVAPLFESQARIESNGRGNSPILFAPLDEASMLGIETGHPSLSPPFRAERSSPNLPAGVSMAGELRPVPALQLDLDGALGSEARSPDSVKSPNALASPLSPLVGLAALDDIPSPSSPHRGPVSLSPPPPLPDGPTGLPAHLTTRAKSRSKSRSRSRSRSRSPDSKPSRTLPPNYIKLPPGMAELTAHTPKVHSPLASPGVKMDATDDEEDGSERGRTASVSPTGSSSPSPGPLDESPLADSVSADSETRATSPPSSATGLGLGDMTAVVEPSVTTSPTTSPPSGPPPSLGPPLLPQISTSPLGTPEHVENSLSPADSTSSYFTLPERTSVASEPPKSALSPSRASVPPLERAPSWEDLEIDEDEDEDDFFGHDDGSGELGFVPTARRRSSGEAGRDRISILEELELEGVSDHATASNLVSGVSIPVAQSLAPPVPSLTASDSLDNMQLDTSLSSQASRVSSVGAVTPSKDERVPDAGREEEEDEGMLGIDEEMLSALERIFICAKSDALEDRARVAHFLPDWLPGVDISDSVEYVLPLLAGFVEEESVKEVFAPKLDRIMWHFFSRCPLIELDPRSGLSQEDRSEDRPELGRAETDEIHKVSFASVETSPMSSNNVSERSVTPPPTTKTSPALSSSALPDLPCISAAAFTSLLGALLTDQSTYVAKATEAAVVRFLCRLKGKPVPPEPVEESAAAEFAFGASEANLITVGTEEAHPATTYRFTDEAKQVLEDEIVCGIVLGLARLDQEDMENRQEDGVNGETAAGPSRRDLSATPDPSASRDAAEDPTLFHSPEEQSLDDAWLAGVNGVSNTGSEQSPVVRDDDSAPTSQPQQIPPASKNAETDSESGDLSFRPESSPLGDAMFSSFSPDVAADQGGEESAIGKMVAMSLIAAITSAGCLDSSVLVEQFLPEVVRMGDEPMFYVRKEAVQALGALAKAMPLDVLQSTVLTLHETFSKDSQWLVRRAAVLAVPSICARLPRATLRTVAVRAVSLFAEDEDRNVRSGALEICGELIYLFHEDPDGVPDEALRFFLGEKAPEESRPSPSHAASNKQLASPLRRDGDDSPPNPFSPLQNSLDSPSTSLLDSVKTWSPIRPWPASRDPEREILTAFNFPAVVLTLGRSQWSRLASHHRELSGDPVEKVRQSLASSLHEVAKIIGPEQSDASLLDLFGWFVVDVDNVQGPVLDNLPSLLRSFTDEGAATALRVLGEGWNQIRLWRQRERVAQQFADFGVDLVRRGHVDAVLELLVRACKDSVAAVREAAVQSVAPLSEACSAELAERTKLLAFLSVFSSDSSYRQRVVYTQCALACVRAHIDRATFENAWLPTLTGLARDRVVGVRIAVARVIGEACKTPSLYSDPATRTNVRDILSTLFDSPDRDVRQPVEDFCAAVDSPATDSTPTPTPTLAVPPMPLPAPVEARPDDSSEDSTMQDVDTGLPSSLSAGDSHSVTNGSDGASEEDIDMAELIGDDDRDARDEDYEDGGFVEVSKAECA